jgi:hypothetical protein
MQQSEHYRIKTTDDIQLNRTITSVASKEKQDAARGLALRTYFMRMVILY